MPTQDVCDLRHLLLVEDTLDDERLALRALRGCGRPLAVRVARDGLQGRRALGLDEAPGESARRSPDLVISDLKLPGLDGRELLCLVRESARLSRVPYIIFSSSNDQGDVQRCLGCGADAYVQKPVDYEAYLDCLQRVTRWALDGLAPSAAPSYAIGLREPCACGQRGV